MVIVMIDIRFKKPSLSRVCLRNMLVLTVLTVGATSVVWGVHAYLDFKANCAYIQESYLEGRKELVRGEVEKVIDYVNYSRELTENRLRENIKSRVYEAHSIATGIYNSNRDKLESSQIQQMIKEALRPIRFSGGRGYYFINNLDGVTQLHADKPELEGKELIDLKDTRGKFLIREMIDITSAKGEGFCQYRWAKPNAEGADHLKITFVKHFEPFNWHIGTGEYFQDVTEDIQREVKDRISQIRYGENGYIFVLGYDLTLLVNPMQPHFVGQNRLDLTDADGVKVAQENVKAAQKPGGDFVRYRWEKPSVGKPCPKISYVKGIDDWGWAIGTGVYIDEIESIIAEKRAQLGVHVILQLLQVGGVLLVVVLIAFVFSGRIFRKLQTSLEVFVSFFKRTTSEDAYVDLESINFSELQHLASSANSMIDKRKAIEKNLLDENTERKLAEDRLGAINQCLLSLGADYDENIHKLTGLIGTVMNATCAVYNRLDRGMLCARGRWNTPDDFLHEDNPDGHICYDVIQGAKGQSTLIRNLQDTSYAESDINVLKYDLHTYYGRPVFLKDKAIASICVVYQCDFVPSKADEELIGIIASAISVEEQRKEAQTALEYAREQADASNEAKSQFLANMSHEIRTPMNAIVGFSDILGEEILDEVHKEYVDIIRSSTMSLLTVINDILDLSKIEAGKVDIEISRCRLSEILKGIDALMNPHAKTKGLEFKIHCCDEIPENILTDSDRLGQCLINLTNNAVKFTDSGHVYLNVSVEKYNDKDFIRFDVEDTGPGIPDEKQQTVFESFTQADGSATRKFGGTGLGLTITKMLAELLGGSISLSSSVGKGSVFTLLIPAGEDAGNPANSADVESDRSVPHTDSEEPNFSGRVLVAEDVLENQQLVRCLLERMGFEVMIVGDGAQAVEKALEVSFDLILMDIQMPNMNGHVATAKLRAEGVTVPVIAVTAYAMAGDDEKCYEAGCTDYISKPITGNKLQEVICKHLKSGMAVN